MHFLKVVLAFVGLAVPGGTVGYLGTGQAAFAATSRERSVARPANESAITPERLRAHLELIAGDELEGRDTPSRGLDFATLYVATQLKLWGAQPGGDNGTFFQKIPLTQKLLDTQKSSIEVGGKVFRFGEGLRGATKALSFDGNVVYVGHGFIVKKKGIDPYANVNVKGKLVVVASGFPEGVSQRDMQGMAGTDYAYPVQAAEKMGAAGILTVAEPASLSGWKPDDAARIGGTAVGDEPAESPGIPAITVDQGLAQSLFQGERITGSDVARGPAAPERSFALSPNKEISVRIAVTKQTKYTRNVVAVVPGTDPVLKDEYVAFGAHIDHVGVGAGPGDQIYNGADDDGSGTVSVLEIAHAMLTGARPKRSALFVWHCGEEKGMWGSTWFTQHPTVPINNIVAQLNIDMIGRSRPAGDTNSANKVLTGPSEIYVVGATKMSTDLQKLSEAVNRDYLQLTLNYKYDDPKDPEGIFFRSDHYLYAKKGIPILFYFDGVHEDYHRPSDEVSKIDFVKMTNVTRTIYATGFALAEAANRPVVDKPLKQ